MPVERELQVVRHGLVPVEALVRSGFKVGHRQGAQHRPTTSLDMLTDREQEVLSLIGRGLTNDEIEAKLAVSPLTAKTHVSRILTKLSARDRAQLVVLAYESGLLSPGGQDGAGGGG